MKGLIYQHCLHVIDTIASLMCVCEASKTLKYWQPALCLATVRSIDTCNDCPPEAVGSSCSSSMIVMQRMYSLRATQESCARVTLQKKACLACSLSASLHVGFTLFLFSVRRSTFSCLWLNSHMRLYQDNNDAHEERMLTPVTAPYFRLRQS